MKAAIVSVAVGLFLLSWSSPTLFRMAVESCVTRHAMARYDVEEQFVDKNRAVFAGNEIVVSDALGVQQVDFYHEVWAPIALTINREDYSVPNLVRIRPRHTDANRYHGSVGLAVLRDKKRRTERFGLIQYLHDPDNHQFDFRARLLLVSSDGTVAEEVFWHSQRADPPYRYMFMHAASMASTGFVYGVYQVWPSLYYPLLFPWVTGFLGAALLLFGGPSLARRARQQLASACTRRAGSPRTCDAERWT